MSDYKYGLVSISFREHNPKDILCAMQKARLYYIEWGSDVHCPPEKAADIAALQTQYGVSCCSYGTYFRLGITPIEELPTYITAAKTLGTDVLRLWCGNKNACEYTTAEKTILFNACKAAAKIAEKNDVYLCMECHANTYTSTKEAAFELMRAVNSFYFRMYWQPNQHISNKENLEYARLLSPYTVHLHVFNWKMDKKYPLCKAKEIWKAYLSCFEKEKTLLLEFMPDGKLESLSQEARSLKEIGNE